jgi:hypothetical protein
MGGQAQGRPEISGDNVIIGGALPKTMRSALEGVVLDLGLD